MSTLREQELREHAIALLLLQQWWRLVEHAQGNVDELLGRTVEFLATALQEEPITEVRSS